MYSTKDLKTEIKTITERTIEAGQRVTAAWITTEICGQHPDISGGDVDFWNYTGTSGVHAEVRKFISSMKAAETDEEKQGALPFTMPGYKYLQKIYFVAEDDQPNSSPVGIPITEMTADQILSKIHEYEKMAEGCIAHARELERYLRISRRPA